jgi:hypothetical protein
MLWLVDRIVDEVTTGSVFGLLPDETQASIRELSRDDVREAAEQVCTRPLPGDWKQGKRLLLNPCLAVQWLSAFEELGLPRNLRVYEPCAGGSEPVVLAAEIYSGGKGHYTTVNLNRILVAELRGKLGKVRMAVEIIEDDATQNPRLGPDSADAACFHHAVNDLLQTAVSEPRGMDTRAIEWWSNERQMIEWLDEDHRSGRLGERALPALYQAVQNATEIVAPGGSLLFDHWTWEGHRNSDWFPWKLFSDMIPMTRELIARSGLPLTDIELKGRDPQWWACFRKSG